MTLSCKPDIGICLWLLPVAAPRVHETRSISEPKAPYGDSTRKRCDLSSWREAPCNTPPRSPWPFASRLDHHHLRSRRGGRARQDAVGRRRSGCSTGPAGRSHQGDGQIRVRGRHPGRPRSSRGAFRVPAPPRPRRARRSPPFTGSSPPPTCTSSGITRVCRRSIPRATSSSSTGWSSGRWSSRWPT